MDADVGSTLNVYSSIFTNNNVANGKNGGAIYSNELRLKSKHYKHLRPLSLIVTATTVKTGAPYWLILQC